MFFIVPHFAVNDTTLLEVRSGTNVNQRPDLTEEPEPRLFSMGFSRGGVLTVPLATRDPLEVARVCEDLFSIIRVPPNFQLVAQTAGLLQAGFIQFPSSLSWTGIDQLQRRRKATVLIDGEQNLVVDASAILDAPSGQEVSRTRLVVLREYKDRLLMEY